MGLIYALGFVFCVLSYGLKAEELPLVSSSTVNINSQPCTVTKEYALAGGEAVQQLVAHTFNPVIDVYIAQSGNNSRNHTFVISAEQCYETYDIKSLTITHGKPESNAPRHTITTLVNGKFIPLTLIGFEENKPATVSAQPAATSPEAQAPQHIAPQPLPEAAQPEAPQQKRGMTEQQQRDWREAGHGAMVAFADGQHARLRAEQERQFQQNQEGFIVGMLQQLNPYQDPNEMSRKIRAMHPLQRDELHKQLFAAHMLQVQAAEHAARVQQHQQQYQHQIIHETNRFKNRIESACKQGLSINAATDIAQLEALFYSGGRSASAAEFNEFFKNLRTAPECAWIPNMPDRLLSRMNAAQAAGLYELVSDAYPNEVYGQPQLYKHPAIRQAMLSLPHAADTIEPYLNQLEDPAAQKQLFADDATRKQVNDWINSSAKYAVRQAHAAFQGKIDHAARILFDDDYRAQLGHAHNLLALTKTGTSPSTPASHARNTPDSLISNQDYELTQAALDTMQACNEPDYDDTIAAGLHADEQLLTKSAYLKVQTVLPAARKRFGSAIEQFDNAQSGFIDQRIIGTINSASNTLDELDRVKAADKKSGFPYEQMQLCLTKSLITHEQSIINRAASLKEAGKLHAAHTILKAGDILQALVKAGVNHALSATYAFGKGAGHQFAMNGALAAKLCTGLATLFSQGITEVATASRIAALCAVTTLCPSDNPLLYEHHCNDIENYKLHLKHRQQQVADGLSVSLAYAGRTTAWVGRNLFDGACIVGAALMVEDGAAEAQSFAELLSKRQQDKIEKLGATIIKGYNALTVEKAAECAGGLVADGLLFGAIHKVGSATLKTLHQIRKVHALERVAQSLKTQYGFAGCTLPKHPASLYRQFKLLDAALKESQPLAGVVSNEITSRCLKNYAATKRSFASTVETMLGEIEAGVVARATERLPLTLATTEAVTQKIAQVDKAKKSFGSAARITEVGRGIAAETQAGTFIELMENNKLLKAAYDNALVEYGLTSEELCMSDLKKLSDIAAKTDMAHAKKIQGIRGKLNAIREKKYGPHVQQWADTITRTSCEQTNKALTNLYDPSKFKSTSTGIPISTAERRSVEDLLRKVHATQHNPVGKSEVLKRIEAAGDWGGVKGAVAEFEVGMKLEAEGQKVVEYGAKQKVPGQATRDLDIVTEKFAYEVKDVDWGKWSQKALTDERSDWVDRLRAAKSINKEFSIYTRNPLPEVLHKWCLENNIAVFIGW